MSLGISFSSFHNFFCRCRCCCCSCTAVNAIEFRGHTKNDHGYFDVAICGPFFFGNICLSLSLWDWQCDPCIFTSETNIHIMRQGRRVIAEEICTITVALRSPRSHSLSRQLNELFSIRSLFAKNMVARLFAALVLFHKKTHKTGA